MLKAIGYSFPIVYKALQHGSIEHQAFDTLMLAWVLYFEVSGNGEEQTVFEAAS